MVKDVYDLLDSELVRVARSMVGTKEEGRNKGYWVEEFQKTVDGMAQGEPWCMAFVHWCIREAERNISNLVGDPFSMSNIFKSESTMEVWGKSSDTQLSHKPYPGALIFWQRHKNGRPTWMGHVGIVSEVLGEWSIKTVEGNTGNGDPREGDGVYEKTLENYQHDRGTLRFKGFLQVW